MKNKKGFWNNKRTSSINRNKAHQKKTLFLEALLRNQSLLEEKVHKVLKAVIIIINKIKYKKMKLKKKIKIKMNSKIIKN
jgi:hypothetical protein